MRKVLIIDDENIIRRGIRAIIERADTGFRTIVECTNGVEALQKVSEESFDLIITDIRMPQMDGLEFIHELQKRNLAQKVIILSGYDDFQYAQKALKYGAKAYLLKPVDRRELIEHLKKIELLIEEEEEKVVQQQKAADYIEHFQTNTLNYMFLNDNIREKQIEGILRTINIDLFDSSYYLSLIAERKQSSQSFCEGQELLLNETVKQYMMQQGGAYLCFMNTEQRLVLVTSQKIEYHKLLVHLQATTKREYAIAASERGTGMLEIRDTYRQAQEAMQYRLLYEGSIVLDYGVLSQKETKYTIPLEEIKKISEILGMKMYKEIDQILSKIFDLDQLQENRIQYLEKIAGAMNQYVFEHFMQYIPQKENELRERYSLLMDLYSYEYVKDYICMIYRFLQEVDEYLLTLKDAYTANNEIDAAIQYVTENYMKDLNMAMVANHVSLNYYYFSHSFKDTTGMSFVDFLKKTRIERAKELLKDSNYRIFEVAERVGYSDSKQFAKIFRSITGLSPKEYRSKYMKI